MSAAGDIDALASAGSAHRPRSARWLRFLVAASPFCPGRRRRGRSSAVLALGMRLGTRAARGLNPSAPIRGRGRGRAALTAHRISFARWLLMISPRAALIRAVAGPNSEFRPSSRSYESALEPAACACNHGHGCAPGIGLARPPDVEADRKARCFSSRRMISCRAPLPAPCSARRGWSESAQLAVAVRVAMRSAEPSMRCASAEPNGGERERAMTCNGSVDRDASSDRKELQLRCS